MSLYDTIMSDTVGTVYRAATGKTDPWTQSEITDDATAAYIQAGMTPDAAATVAQSDVQTGLDTANISWWQAASQSFGPDNGTGCGLGNISGCVGFDISWVPYVLAGAGVLVVLYVLGPYVGLLERSRQ